MVFTVLRRTVLEYQRDNISRYGAALAYYTIFSLPAIIIVIISTTGLIVGKATVEAEVFDKLSGLFGADIAFQIKKAVEGITKAGHNRMAAIIGFIVLIFGAAGVFNALQDALHTIFRVYHERRQNFLQTIINRIMSIGMVICLGFLLITTLVINALLVALNQFADKNREWIHEKLIGDLSFLRSIVDSLTDNLFFYLNYGISYIFIAVFFLFLYKILPDAHIRWKYAWRGSLVVALLFVLGKFLIEYYLAKTNMTTAYGAAGTVIAILIWVYYSSQLVFLGAELIKAMSMYDGVSITPRAYAHKIIDSNPIRNLTHKINNQKTRLLHWAGSQFQKKKKVEPPTGEQPPE